MLRIPGDLPVADLVGQTVTRVCAAENTTQIEFRDGAQFVIEGTWRLLGGSKDQLDGGSGAEAARATQLPLLVRDRVRSCVVASDRLLLIRMESGRSLELLDDSDQFESFTFKTAAGELWVI